ncbi:MULTISPECIES: hypothetical protein [unclassified Burkholderia]|uniref:hypothetical protein n=1 Tax=unclassified Burkholderia TaxID=2613784 RepID=UPI001D103FC5|nr:MULTISPECIES: hypothetical protein [unclassified Burkholderia]
MQPQKKRTSRDDRGTTNRPEDRIAILIALALVLILGIGTAWLGHGDAPAAFDAAMAMAMAMAKRGALDGEFSVALMYEHGDGIERNHAEAAHLRGGRQWRCGTAEYDAGSTVSWRSGLVFTESSNYLATSS